MSDLQQANMEFMDLYTGPKPGLDHEQGSDVDQVLYRIRTHGGTDQILSWDSLSTCWRPFRQAGPGERQFWSRARLLKALDEAERLGLIKALDALGARYQAIKPQERTS